EGGARRRGPSLEVVGCESNEPPVCLDRIVEPTSDEVAGRSAARQHFVMTTAAAEVACPAAFAWILEVNMPLGKPCVLACPIDARREVAHHPIGVVHEPMTRRQAAVGRDTEVTRARAARVGAMRSAMQLAKRVDHVQERVTLATQQPALEGQAA